MRWKMGGAFRKQQKVLLPFVVAWPGAFCDDGRYGRRAKRNDGDCGAVAVCLFFSLDFVIPRYPMIETLLSAGPYALIAFWRSMAEVWDFILIGNEINVQLITKQLALFSSSFCFGLVVRRCGRWACRSLSTKSTISHLEG